MLRRNAQLAVRHARTEGISRNYHRTQVLVPDERCTRHSGHTDPNDLSGRFVCRQDPVASDQGFDQTRARLGLDPGAGTKTRREINACKPYSAGTEGIHAGLRARAVQDKEILTRLASDGNPDHADGITVMDRRNLLGTLLPRDRKNALHDEYERIPNATNLHHGVRISDADHEAVQREIARRIDARYIWIIVVEDQLKRRYTLPPGCPDRVQFVVVGSRGITTSPEGSACN